ncbi:hypothetical protein D3C86_1819950 [compost metagenome]
MGDSERRNEEGGNHHPERGGLHAIVCPGLLAEENVQRPADAGCECVTGTHEVNARACRVRRDKQQQADDRQADPHEVDGLA